MNGGSILNQREIMTVLSEHLGKNQFALTLS